MKSNFFFAASAPLLQGGNEIFYWINVIKYPFLLLLIKELAVALLYLFPNKKGKQNLARS